MSKLEDLHTLVRLLKEFEFPVSPILEYAIKEKEDELCADSSMSVNDETNIYEQSVAEVCEPITFASLKDEFSDYLYKTKSERTARNYLHYIEKPIRVYINNVVDPKADSVYSCNSVAEVRALTLKLKADVSFISDNLKWHNALTAALTSYLKFLENKENV